MVVKILYYDNKCYGENVSFHYKKNRKKTKNFEKNEKFLENATF